MTRIARIAALALLFLGLSGVGPIGTATVSPLPVPGVDVGPGWATTLNTAITELQGYVALKIGNASLNITDADVKHGARTVYYGAASCQGLGTSAFTGATSQFWQGAAAGDTVACVVDQAINERITAVSVYGRANGATAWSWKLYSVNASTGVVTQVGSTQTSAITAAISKLSVSALTQTVATDTYYVAEWTAGASGNREYAVELVFDKTATP